MILKMMTTEFYDWCFRYFMHLCTSIIHLFYYTSFILAICNNMRRPISISILDPIKIDAVNSYRQLLFTHWGRDKMAAISQTIFSNAFSYENVRISIKISLKFVPKDPINNIPALGQIMPWRRRGDKPLSAPMMVSLLTHICVTRPQWVKYGYPSHDCLYLSTFY